MQDVRIYSQENPARPWVEVMPLKQVQASLVEVAGVDTVREGGCESLSVGAASLLLEPGNELVNGEGLGECGTGVSAGGGGGGSRGLGLLGRGGGSLVAGADVGGLGSGDRGGGRAGGSGRGRSSGSRGRDRGGRRGGSGRGGTRAGTIPDGWAGDVITGALALGARNSTTVDVAENTWVSGAVGLRHVDASRKLSRAGAGNLDLTAAIVELGSALSAGLVEGDDLRADEVVTSLKAGEGDSDGTLIGDEVVNTPLAAAQALLVDLDPDIAFAIGLGRGDVDHDGPLVGSSNGLVTVTLACGVVVVPLHGKLGTGSDLNGIGSLGAAVADHGGRGHILDRVVAIGGGADGLVLALILSVNDETLEGSVGSGELASSDSEEDGGLHFDDRISREYLLETGQKEWLGRM